ncbi:Ras GTPase-activating protein-binding protein 1-like protein isoform X1, partial [Tanacetum coccineum]
IGKAFVERYYAMLHESPGLVYLFYKDISKLGRPEADGSLSVTSSMHAIKAKILSLNYGDFMIKSIDAQVSLNGSVNILVTGYLTGKDNVMKNFAQSFFLAPQGPGGYFVLNDMFRYVENNTNYHTEKVEAEDREYEKQYIVLF